MANWFALNSAGRPSFNELQNYGSAGLPLHFYVFDLLILEGRDVMGHPLIERRHLLERHVLPRLVEPIRYSSVLKASLRDLIRSVKAQGLEGLVTKRTGQQVRVRPAFRSLDEDACEPGAGIRDRRVHAITQELRCSGAGLTAAKMARPVLVRQFEFVERTEDSHLRLSRFMALRDDKRQRT